MMTIKTKLVAGLTASLIAASTSFAMAQATGKENNATTGSEAGSGPASGAEKKGTPGMQGETMQGSSSSMEMKNGQPPVEGVAGAPTPQMGDHHQPTTGAGR